MRRVLAGAAFAIVAIACGPGTRCPVEHGETVVARPLRCTDLDGKVDAFDGQMLDLRGRIEHRVSGPAIRLIDEGVSGDCGRLAGTGIVLRLKIDRKVQSECTKALDRKFVRVVGTMRAIPDAASGTNGEIAPVAIIPPE